LVVVDLEAEVEDLKAADSVVVEALMVDQADVVVLMVDQVVVVVLVVLVVLVVATIPKRWSIASCNTTRMVTTSSPRTNCQSECRA
jgi:hypothetical protein